ncbi:MAG TPA: J domain-containing protein [Candidatus Obscuribacterales bacterium]
MSFQIEQGLFKFDFTDYHAILGVPVDADPDQIRQRYKQIARRLHPDSCQAESKAEKELAVQLFSKLVSPAYTQLSKDSNRKEYAILLGLMGKRLAREMENLPTNSEATNLLAQASGNIDNVYRKIVQKLAANQYESLNKVLEAIAELSEVNTIYLIRKENEAQGVTTPIKSVATATSSSTPDSATKSPAAENKPEEPPKPSPAEPYIHRAEEYLAMNNIAKAVLELRDAMNLEPNNSTCHSLLGIAYLKQNQRTMAKIHINKALELNPEEPKALEGKKVLDRIAQKAAGSNTSGSKTTTPQQSNQGKSSEQSGGGLFGGLFGGKKK